MNVTLGEASAAEAGVALGTWRVTAVCGVVAVAVATGVALPGVLAVGTTATAVVFGAACSVDVREHRLPNRLMATAAAIVAATAAAAAALGDVRFVDSIRGALTGVVLSGAAVLAVVWLVRPNAIGGGDVKMLGVAGAMLGVADPLAALVAGWVGVVVQLIASVVLRRRHLPFGPALFAGFVVGAMSTLLFHASGTMS